MLKDQEYNFTIIEDQETMVPKPEIYGHHLCILKEPSGSLYYKLLEFSIFGWVIDDEEDENVDIVAYMELFRNPKEAVKELQENS